MHHDDLSAEGKAYARAFGLGGEERYEDAVDDVGQYSGAVVADGEAHSCAWCG